VLILLEQDSFSETFVPRSLIPEFLLKAKLYSQQTRKLPIDKRHVLARGDAKELIQLLGEQSVNCIVTSTPYWGMRLYKDSVETTWADGEVCAFGHEQTPEGFIRHSVEILFHLKRVLALDGSIWWNLMDTYNTRTQIRESAAETLRAMRGEDARRWKDYKSRRYSSGHSHLWDGEQCLIPARVAERASRLGYLVKSMIYWKKDGSMPETVRTRVTREAETIIHLTLKRTPYFNKNAFKSTPAMFGGQNHKFESDKITDIWCLATANGTDGHGAQFPVALPGRCIALSSRKNDTILDPFVGSGTTSVAAQLLNRRSIGFDVSDYYLKIAKRRLAKSSNQIDQQADFLQEALS
jgi:DNA modification methylase